MASAGPTEQSEDDDTKAVRGGKAVSPWRRTRFVTPEFARSILERRATSKKQRRLGKKSSLQWGSPVGVELTGKFGRGQGGCQRN